RHCEVARRHERLDLEQDRSRSLECAGNSGANLAFGASSEQFRGLRNADEPGSRHLENPELVRRAEAVLRRAQDAVRLVTIALELEHAVDEMLEHAWAGDRAVLGHVADEERRHVRLLGHTQQARSGLANLGDGAGSRADLRGVERLYGVDHAHLRPLTLERRADGLELGLREDLDLSGAAEPGGSDRKST